MSSPVKTSKAFDLIDVKALEKSTPSPEKTRKPAMSKSDEFKIEGLIEVSDDDDDDDGVNLPKQRDCLHLLKNLILKPSSFIGRT